MSRTSKGTSNERKTAAIGDLHLQNKAVSPRDVTGIERIKSPVLMLMKDGSGAHRLIRYQWLEETPFSINNAIQLITMFL